MDIVDALRNDDRPSLAGRGVGKRGCIGGVVLGWWLSVLSARCRSGHWRPWRVLTCGESVVLHVGMDRTGFQVAVACRLEFVGAVVTTPECGNKWGNKWATDVLAGWRGSSTLVQGCVFGNSESGHATTSNDFDTYSRTWYLRRYLCKYVDYFQSHWSIFVDSWDDGTKTEKMN